MGQAQPKFSSADYLVWEPLQTQRHMFVDGEVYAMAGGTAEHNDTALAAAMLLRHHLRGTPCKTFIGDMRVHVALADAYFYPDVVVSCDAADTQDPKLTTLSAPKLIVEVLSPSTAAYDRGQKFALYRTLASLQEYLLLDPELKTAELFRKTALGVWEFHPFTEPDSVIQLDSVAWAGPRAALFE